MYCMFQMYYVKESVPSNFSGVLPLPDLFEIPCDGDNFTLEASQCDQFPKRNVTYYSCPFSGSRYEDTILEIPDSKCPGEDRLLLCELHGRDIETNVQGDTRTIFDPTFIKTAHNENVRRSSRSGLGSFDVPFCFIGRITQLLSIAKLD